MERHPNAATDSLDAVGVEASDTTGETVGDTTGETAGDTTGGSLAPHRIRTDRLVLRRAHSDEIEFDRLHALFGKVADAEEVFELCGWDAHEDEAETRAYLDQKAEQWERGESYEYVLESIANDDLVGTAILEVSPDDGSGEFGFWLRKPYWGNGLAGEGTDALVHAAFECLDAPFVVAGCLASNDQSRRAIEKFVRRYGGAYFGSVPTVPSRYEVDCETAPVVAHHEWVITREQYESGDAGLSTMVPGVSYDDIEFG